MKRYFHTVIFMLFLSTILSAQEDESNWSISGVAGINISQVAFSNWTQGGENSLSYTLFGNFGLNYAKEAWKLTNSLKLSFGRTKLGKGDFRTNDNELYMESVLSYNVGWIVDPFASNIIKTVITDGFDYGSIPFIQNAAFFDPGYVTQAFGFTYNSNVNFKSRLGLAFQEVFVSEFSKYTDDPTTSEIETFKFETGIESVTEVKFTIADNLLYQSYLRLFGRFEDIKVWDVRWDNTITAKINSFLNVNLNVLVIYEKIQSPKTQLKEALQIGFTYNLF